MLVLKIDKSAANVTDMATYLNDVAAEVLDGKTTGQDWEMTGEPEAVSEGENSEDEGGVDEGADSDL